MKKKLQVKDWEKKVSVEFNIWSSTMGMRDTRWGRVCILMFGFWTLLTSMICFEKPDFLNLTMSCLGLYILLDP